MDVRSCGAAAKKAGTASSLKAALKFRHRQHLISSENFRKIYAQGQKAKGRGMTVHVAHSPSESRLGVTIRRLTLKSSVDRNKWKRWIREVFRHHPEKMANLQVVVTVFSSPSGWTYVEVESELLKLVDSACQELKKRAKIQHDSADSPD